LKIGEWGEYSSRRKRRLQDTGAHCIVKRFTICAHHQLMICAPHQFTVCTLHQFTICAPHQFTIRAPHQFTIRAPHQGYSANEVQEDEAAGPEVLRRKTKCIQAFDGKNLKEIHNLEDPVLDGIIILKLILK
jgi:hypothetical protein